MAVSNITLSDKDLYYQWLINNNSASTMFNALSGNNSSESSSLSAISSLANTAFSGSVGSVLDTSLLGSLGGLTGVQGTESVSSFAKILESCLNKANSGTSGVTGLDQDVSSSWQAAQMAEKLSGVLEEAAKTEDISSLTYKTVKEIYEYFSGQVSGRAAELLGDKVSLLKNVAGTEVSEKESVSGKAAEDVSSVKTEDYFDKMDRMAVQGEEFDFSVFDELVDNSFGEKMLLS